MAKRIWIALVAIVAVIILGVVCMFSYHKYSYKSVEGALQNPMMGFAPRADGDKADGDNTLVYVDLTFRDWEPKEGVFDTASLEDKYQLEKWSRAGKKVVFRFVCDVPGSESHMDIPDWLYEQTGDGTAYDMEYGKGYSPDYENETFIRCHKEAIEALGEAYGQDDFFCFIELGSLGHWGEWHTNWTAGIEQFPDEETCRAYVEPYVTAFPNAYLLMRRPFSFVSEYGLGVYNDMTGAPDDTAEWLDWIKNGGVYEDAKDQMKLVACKSVWETAPIGGEFTSSIPMETMLGDDLSQTLDLLNKSHATFLGPKCPDGEVPEAESQVLEHVGYRYGISGCSVLKNRLTGTVSLKMTAINRGVAPMYADWPVMLYFLDEDGAVLEQRQLDCSLKELQQNQSQDIKVKLGKDDYPAETCYYGIGIKNPVSNQPEVVLDMNVKAVDGVYLLNE